MALSVSGGCAPLPARGRGAWGIRSVPLLLSALVLVVALSGLTAIARAEEPVARVWYFHTELCQSCQAVSRDVVEPLQAKYGSRLEVRRFEVSEPTSYALLVKAEEKYRPTNRVVPEIIVGDRALGGEDEIRRELEGEIEACLARGGCAFPAVGEAGATAAGSGAPIHLAYFVTRGCAECDRAAYDLRYVRDRYPGLVVTEFDISAPENKRLNEALGGRLGVPVDRRLISPAVFVGETSLVGREITAEALDAALSRYATTGAPAVWEDPEVQRDAAAGDSIVARFRAFGAAPVLLAGLVDGLNPCAFATMIFFVSYLAVAGRRGREIVFVGAAFTLGVFLAYMLIGLGFLTAIKSLSFLVAAAKVVYLATGLLCLGLAALNLRDYVRIRRGGLAEMTLQLPGFLKDRVRSTIRHGARARQFALAAFASGFVISFLELLCTGQVYLPTIVFVVGVPELRAQATAMLVLYNIAFILPLIGIFVLTYLGTTSGQLTRFLQRRAGAIKLALAVLFIALGGWLVYSTLA